MNDMLMGIAAFFAWAVLWLLFAGLLTVLSLAASLVLERRFLWPEKWTFLMWVAALTVCPAIVFVCHWTLFGLLVDERLYEAVRFGGLAAGLAYIPIGVLVVNRPGERDDKAYEVFTLVASSVASLVCCAALVWAFGPVSRFMAGMGG